MIEVTFQFGLDIIEIRVDNNNVTFKTGQYGGAFVPLEGLKLNKEGVIKEHPDLIDKENWKEESIRRFKEHIKNLGSETLAMKYIITELNPCGYKPLYFQRAGHRPQKFA